MMKSCVTAVIFDRSKEKVLCILRRDTPVWVFPGGAIDPGETPEEAVIREISEESGLTVVISRKIAVYSPINRLSDETHLFECQLISGTLKTGDETKDLGFFSIHDLPRAFFHIHKDMLIDTMKYEQEVMYKPFSQITYWELFKYFLRHPIRVVRFALSKLGVAIH